jgi:hypothetical protein
VGRTDFPIIPGRTPGTRTHAQYRRSGVASIVKIVSPPMRGLQPKPLIAS